MTDRLERGWSWFHELHRTSDVIRPEQITVTDPTAEAAYAIRSRGGEPRSVVIQLRVPVPGAGYRTGLASVTRFEGEAEDCSYTSLDFESELVLGEARWVGHIEPPKQGRTRLS